MISLKAGLNWLIGLVLAATLLINLSIQLMHAGPRVRAESGSNLRLTRELVLRTIASLPEQEDPLPALRSLYANLGSLRHVEIKVLGVDEPVPAHWPDMSHDLNHDVPAWFVRLVGASPRVIAIPITRGKRDYGRIAIISHPLDELQEIWSDMRWLASISLAVTLAILALVIFLVRFSLSPFDALQAGLADLEAGKSGVRIPSEGATEFKNISNALNSLAATLDRVQSENRKLVNELIEVQDNERREIARDLHDEAGPCLFSIRAAAAAMREAISREVPDQDRLRQAGSILEKSSESLQSLFRGMLERLRPRGLAELGLEAALRGLFATWEISRPEVALRLFLPHDLSSLDEATSFTAYRIVQEGVTNIFRHADADWAEVRLEFGWGSADETSGADPESRPQLEISIEDNGVGIPENLNSGVGLLGMRERVQALGGKLEIMKRPSGGTLIRASIPLSEDDDEEGDLSGA